MSWETAWTVARPVLIALLLIILLVRLFEDRLIFFPNAFEAGSWSTHGMGPGTEDVFLTTSDGAKIHAWWVPVEANEVNGEGEAVPTILYFHGNAGNLTNRVENIIFLMKLPASVLAVDYRRYGKSEGPFPTEEGVYRDARAAYDYLVSEKGIKPERLIILGQSLGAAVAVNLAAEREAAGLILEAGFPSAPRVAQRSMPLPGFGYIIRTQFDSASKLKDYRKPVLIAHCTDDPVIPFDLGEELFAAAREPRTFVRYDAACHEPLYIVAPQDYAARLREFIEEVLPKK